MRTSSGECEISIGPGLLENLGSIVRRASPRACAAFLVMDEAIAPTLGELVKSRVEHAGVGVTCMRMHAAETNKTLATVERVFELMLRAGIERDSVVIALGGGIVCDIAGFTAATFHRGLPLVMAPTTLLAMVDASIGGKNGVNFGSLKNMVGTIWPPRAIVIDPVSLASLPIRHVRCGLAESIKVALLGHDALLEGVVAMPARIEQRDWRGVSELIAASAAIKARIVETDEREDSPTGRASLNLGHTFAHAFELLPGLDLMHGEAVAIGLAAAAHAARVLGRLSETRASQWRSVIERAQLPLRLPQPIPLATLLPLMQRDKKARHGRIRLVLPCAAGGAELVDDVPIDVIRAALLEIGATA